MRLTKALSHLVKVNNNVYEAKPLFDFKRKQHKLAKRYKRWFKR